MTIGVDVNSLGYDVMPDRYYVYADGRAKAHWKYL